MNRIDRAFALGAWDDDDPLLAAWISTARSHLVPAERPATIADVIPRLDAHSLVLFRLPMDVEDDPGLAALLETPARLVLYVAEGAGAIAPSAAVDLCKRNVLTVVEQRPDLPYSLSRRLDRVYTGGEIYRAIEVKVPDGKNCIGTSFIVSPYSRTGDQFQAAAIAALKGRNLHVLDPRETLSQGVLKDNLTVLFRAADFIVADVRVSDAGPNKNVWLEIGAVAIGLQKTALLAVPAEISLHDLVPSDLAGQPSLRYWNHLDLTMKLFWGLRWIHD